MTSIAQRLARLESGRGAAAPVPVIEIVGIDGQGIAHPGFALVHRAGRYETVTPHEDEALTAFRGRCEIMAREAGR